MNYCCKIICCLLFCFAAGKAFAQKPGKDSMPDYMKRFKYYTLPGFPDSATFEKRMDSAMQRKKIMDSLQRRIDSLQRKKAELQGRIILSYTEQKKKATRLRVA
jgi:hypothetical protein